MTKASTQPDSPNPLKPLAIPFGIFLAGLLGADLLIHPHAYFGVDGWPGFNPLFGLLSGLALPAVALGLSFLVKRAK